MGLIKSPNHVYLRSVILTSLLHSYVARYSLVAQLTVPDPCCQTRFRDPILWSLEPNHLSTLVGQKMPESFSCGFLETEGTR